jgi:glycine/D-amino acid oxidase-like deaminating enzyme
LLGAAYSVEGMLDPLRFTHAYARAAIQQGATLRRNSPVISMEVHGHKVISVSTATETFYTEKIAVMAGAWESEVTRLAGVEIPLQNTHAESLITEPIPRMIFNNVGLSDTYEIINGKDRAVALGIIPEPNGTVEIAEAVFRTDEKHHRVSAWGISAMAVEMVKIFPFLGNVRIVRSWGRPTSFAPDEEPIIGWVPQLDNMYVATSLVETITTVPLLSEWMSMMIQGQSPPLSLDLYSPARFQ